MTKREALRECRKMWLWLAANPGCTKDDAPDYLGIHLLLNECPCCEYVSSNNLSDRIVGGKECANVCPLKKLWPIGCMFGLSPYRSWSHEINATESALKIADACLDRRKR